MNDVWLVLFGSFRFLFILFVRLFGCYSYAFFPRICETITLTLDHPNASGALLGDSLWKLPNRRFHPEYYFTITKPISMAQIGNKLKKGEYNGINNLTADLTLMIENAKKAFPSTHKIHKDAVKMSKLLNQKLAEMSLDEETDGDEESTTNSSTQSAKRKNIRPKISASISPAASISGSMGSLSNVSPSVVGNSPKCKFPNNPLLKKKLLNLQKFLSEYTVKSKIYEST